MINTNKLRGVIVEKGLSQKKVAQELGITEQTFSTKMKTGVFNSVEIDLMIGLLDIEDPMAIFFANHVS